MEGGQRKPYIFLISILVGGLLLVSGPVWYFVIADRIISSASDTMRPEFPPERDLFVGEMGLLSLAWPGPSAKVTGDGLDLELKDFDTLWKDVRVRSSGIFEGSGNEPLVAMDLSGQFEGDGSFPMGGLKRRDYTLDHILLEEEVIARFDRSERIDGDIAYLYSLDIDSVAVEDPEAILEGGSLDLDVEMPIEAELEYLLTDRTVYRMDPRTSIPLDISLDIGLDMVFPDITLTPVLKDNRSYAIEEMESLSTSGPGEIETRKVIVERQVDGRIDGNDTDLAIMSERFFYYDAETGDPLPPEEQGEIERYVVDRRDHSYVTGYLGTRRSGHHQFPIGHVPEQEYELWDPLSESSNIARFTGRGTMSGNDVVYFRMDTIDAEVDAGNPFLPIPGTPFTDYRMDAVQSWTLDAGSGSMLDYSIQGVVSVIVPGPFLDFKEQVARFNVTFADNTTDLLNRVARLYREVLLPLSGTRSNVFGLKATFAPELRLEMEDLSDTASFYLDIAERWVPLSLSSAGVCIIALVLVVRTFARIKGKGRAENSHLRTKSVDAIEMDREGP